MLTPDQLATLRVAAEFDAARYEGNPLGVAAATLSSMMQSLLGHIDDQAAELERYATQVRPTHMTGDDVIKLAVHIIEPVHVWARPNPSATWTLIPIQPANSRGIEYGMRSWEFFGPICPPKEPL